MESLINQDLEFFEVLNAFPCLKEKLQDSKFDLKDLKEGKTIHDYFSQKSYSEEEIDLLVRSLNQDVKHFLKNGTLPTMHLTDEKIVLDMSHEEEE